MSSKITFIGDVMLGRIIGTKYHDRPYDIVAKELIAETEGTDYVIANLESPVAINANTEGDHLQFKGNPEALNCFKWITAFSLANNHINDCGELGMDETISILDSQKIKHNGLFKGDYTPLVFEKDHQKIAIVTITDMMNIPFSENCEWDILRVGEERVLDVLKWLRSENYFVILYAHIGMLFSRYPNPVSYNYLHQCVDYGANLIVTAHSHCLGCKEQYKDSMIFHSLGDFVMDGNSFRRRQSAMLEVEIENNCLKTWRLIPAVLGYDYQTKKADKKSAREMLKDFANVSNQLAIHKNNYMDFFKWQYKKEMISHTLSTLSFLVKTKGIVGLLKLLLKRSEEVIRMFIWLTKDRSKDRRDDDAIRDDRKKFKQEELFNN